jgi:hypothetical protein
MLNILGTIKLPKATADFVSKNFASFNSISGFELKRVLDTEETNSCYNVCVDAKLSKMLFIRPTGTLPGVYYATSGNGGNTWSTPESLFAIATHTQQECTMAFSLDGTKGIIFDGISSPKRIFSINWSDSVPQTTNLNQSFIEFSSLTISLNGIYAFGVASTKFYYSTWNSTNFDPFVEISTSSQGGGGIAVTPSLDRILSPNPSDSNRIFHRPLTLNPFTVSTGALANSTSEQGTRGIAMLGSAKQTPTYIFYGNNSSVSFSPWNGINHTYTDGSAISFQSPFPIIPSQKFNTSSFADGRRMFYSSSDPSGGVTTSIGRYIFELKLNQPPSTAGQTIGSEVGPVDGTYANFTTIYGYKYIYNVLPRPNDQSYLIRSVSVNGALTKMLIVASNGFYYSTSANSDGTGWAQPIKLTTITGANYGCLSLSGTKGILLIKNVTDGMYSLSWTGSVPVISQISVISSSRPYQACQISLNETFGVISCDTGGGILQTNWNSAENKFDPPTHIVNLTTFTGNETIGITPTNDGLLLINNINNFNQLHYPYNLSTNTASAGTRTHYTNTLAGRSFAFIGSPSGTPARFGFLSNVDSKHTVYAKWNHTAKKWDDINTLLPGIPEQRGATTCSNGKNFFYGETSGNVSILRFITN